MPKNKHEISRETFDHLVRLAALKLGEEESKYLLTELNKQLSAIRELEAIEVGKEIPPASHGVEYRGDNSPPLRDDLWTACEDADAIIGQAPSAEDRFIIVPEIPHTTLE